MSRALGSDVLRFGRLWPIAFPILGAFVAYAGVTRGWLFALLPMAAGVGLAFVLIALPRPMLALLPVGVLLPFAGYLIVLLSGQGMSVVFDALTVLCFLPLMVRVLPRGGPLSLLSGYQAIVWAFFVLALLQTLNPDGGGLPVGLWGIRRTVLPILLFFVAYHLDLSESRSLVRAARIFTAVGVVVAAWGLKQHFVGPTGSEHAYASLIGTFWVSGELRIFSTFTTPWAFSGYLAASGLLAVALAMGARTLGRRSVHWLQAVLFTMTLVFTYMRGPFLGFTVGLVFLGVVYLGRRLGRGWVVTLFLTLVAGYALFTMVVGPAIARQVAPDSVAARRLASFIAPLKESGMEERFTLWEQIWPVVAEYPLGLGLGSSGGIAERFEDRVRFGAVHSDNMHLAMLMELGWPGGLLFVVITVWTILRGLGRIELVRDEQTRWIMQAALGFLVMMAVAHLVTPLMFEPGVGQLFWTASGLVVNPTFLRGSRPPQSRDITASGSRPR